MYLRYTQPPADLYDWYEDYFQDEEAIDVKAGGGQVGQLYDYFFLLSSNTPVFLNILYYNCSIGINDRPNGLPIFNEIGLVFNTFP